VFTDENIRGAVGLWLANANEAARLYGPIAVWNTASVTTMKRRKCLLSLARAFPSWIDPRGDCVCKGRVPRATTMRVLRAFGLALPCSLSLANSFEDLFEL
jgi:hypothetical protein